MKGKRSLNLGSRENRRWSISVTDPYMLELQELSEPSKSILWQKLPNSHFATLTAVITKDSKRRELYFANLTFRVQKVPCGSETKDHKIERQLCQTLFKLVQG